MHIRVEVRRAAEVLELVHRDRSRVCQLDPGP